MISNIDDDRIEIRGRIEESLKKLIREDTGTEEWRNL